MKSTADEGGGLPSPRMRLDRGHSVDPLTKDVLEFLVADADLDHLAGQHRRGKGLARRIQPGCEAIVAKSSIASLLPVKPALVRQVGDEAVLDRDGGIDAEVFLDIRRNLDRMNEDKSDATLVALLPTLHLDLLDDGDVVPGRQRGTALVSIAGRVVEVSGGIENALIHGIAPKEMGKWSGYCPPSLDQRRRRYL